MRLDNRGDWAFGALVAALLLVAIVLAAFVFAIVAYFPLVGAAITLVVCVAVLWLGVKYFTYYF